MKTNTINSILNKYKYELMSFIAASICMYLALAQVGVTFIRKYTLVNGDMLSIYIPAIKNLCRDIIEGESIYYSWNTCMGMNTSLYNAFYAMSPLNIFYLVEGDIYTITVLLIIIRTGIAAMGFQLFVSRVHKISGLSSVVFSVCYSMCSFQMAYNTTNTIWMDALFVLPFVFLHVHYLIEGETYLGLIFWYAYIFISQFYMGYMIGLISGLYFLLLIIQRVRKDTIKIWIPTILKYLYSVIISISIAAFVWLPTLYFIRDNHVEDSTRHISYRINAIDVILRMFWEQKNVGEGYFPNMYCGMIVLLLVPLYFINKKIKLCDKLIYGGLLALVIISCTIDPLYMFWHGFDNPDGWPFRFTYIASFIVCVMAVESFEHMLNTKNYLIWIVAISCAVLCYFGVNWQRKRFLRSDIIDDRQILINIFLIVSWAVILTIYISCKQRERRLVIALTLLAVMVEAASGYTSLHTSGSASSKAWYDSLKTATEDLNADDSLYRVNSLYDLCVNSGTLFGFNGFGHFASSENERVTNALGKLGIYASPRIFMHYGLNPATQMLFDIKYDIHGIFENIYDDNSFTANVKCNDRILNIGYMINNTPSEYVLSNKDAFRNINDLLTMMTGRDICVFDEIHGERISAESEGLELYYTDIGYRIEADLNSDNKEKSYTFYVKPTNNRTFAYIANNYSMRESSTDYFLLAGGEENAINNDGDLKVSYIKELDKNGDQAELVIKQRGDISSVDFKNIYFYEYHPEMLNIAYDILKDEQLMVEEYHDGYIRGGISVHSNKHTLFTSIPYDRGWNIKIDGESEEITPILNGAFISVENIPTGDHQIEFVFEAIGRRTGILISIMGLLIYLINVSFILWRKHDW